MIDRELLQDLIRRTFRDWTPPTASDQAGGQRAVLQPTWLTVTQVLDTIRRHATQLPGIGADKVHKITRDQVHDELRSMPEMRRRDANTVREAFAPAPPRHPHHG
jgi:hypothetical protein